MCRMNNQIVAHQKRIRICNLIRFFQGQRSVRTRLDAKGLSRILTSVQAEIADMDQLRHQFRIDRAVRTAVRTGPAGHAAKTMTDQQFPLVFLLLESLFGTGIHAMRLFTPTADQGVTGQLCA